MLVVSHYHSTTEIISILHFAHRKRLQLCICGFFLSPNSGRPHPCQNSSRNKKIRQELKKKIRLNGISSTSATKTRYRARRFGKKTKCYNNNNDHNHVKIKIITIIIIIAMRVALIYRCAIQQ